MASDSRLFIWPPVMLVHLRKKSFNIINIEAFLDNPPSLKWLICQVYVGVMDHGYEKFCFGNQILLTYKNIKTPTSVLN